MNQISAISNRGEVRFMTYAKAMNAALFLVFLEQAVAEHDGEGLPDGGPACRPTRRPR